MAKIVQRDRGLIVDPYVQLAIDTDLVLMENKSVTTITKRKNGKDLTRHETIEKVRVAP